VALHPQAQSLINMFVESGAPPLPECTVAEARERTDMIPQLLGAGPELAKVEDISIPGPAGDIPARVYTPAESPIGTIVYVHGGGWVVGTLDTFDPFCRAFAKESGCKVVSVDYRLAPEHPFPAAADDAFAALQWVAENMQEGPLVVAGDSAGGNLAAVSARRARDAGGPELALQFLVYPVTDHDFETPSYAQHGSGDPVLMLSRADMEWFWDHYAPSKADRDHPDASPLKADDLSGVAPAHVVVAEHDPLRDEGLAYAEKLKAAGVPVTVRHYDDQSHGFLMMVNFLDTANEGVKEHGQAVRAALGGR
jgi:acetyl esterase